jgi:hypothetical protein
MTIRVNKEEKDRKSTSEYDYMEMEGWSARSHKVMNQEMMIVSKDGIDQIIVNNPGEFHQILHPISGDFGIVALLIEDGENWLRSIEKMSVAQGQGHLHWLDWKWKRHERDIAVEEFFETFTDTGTASVGMSI